MVLETTLNDHGSPIAPQQHLVDLEASLMGHQEVMKQLDRVHDGQLRPYCALLEQRIQSTIVPLLEDAIVAVHILINLGDGVPKALLEGLQHRIQLGLEYPPYAGGGSVGA